MNTMPQLAAEEILQMIREEGYKAGDKLPTEKELCSALNVGRNTVREALKILASQNVITIRQGAGSYISDKQGVPDDPLGFSMVNDREKLVRDLLQVRELIEPEIAAIAAENASDQDIRELEEILTEMEEVMRKEEPFSEPDIRFHSKIAECTHNVVMQNLLPVIRKGVEVFAEEVPAEYRQTIVSHRNIFEAIKAHKPAEAKREMSFHLLFNDNRYKKD